MYDGKIIFYDICTGVFDRLVLIRHNFRSQQPAIIDSISDSILDERLAALTFPLNHLPGQYED